MMTENDVSEIIILAQNNGIEIMLDGGWGIDALIGKQTREHNDVDVFIELKDKNSFIDLLIKKGYKEIKKEYTTAAHRVWEDAINRIIDLHLFEYDSDGLLFFEGKSYPADTFGAIGKIAGKEVRCITPEYQLLFHLGYEHDEIDAQDVRLLCEHFHLPLPTEYK